MKNPASPVRSWQAQLAASTLSGADLAAALGLPPLPPASGAEGQFPVRVPPGFLAAIVPGQVDDPLLRQVLPVPEEEVAAPGFAADPLGEGAVMPRPGLLHKYRGRVLLIATGACAIHCRYCFRRHFPYQQAHAGGDDFAEALEYIAKDASIREVILSGGDPLVLNDRRLAALSGALAAIPHVERLRIHTRVPTVLPERISDEFIAWFAPLGLRKVVVVHVNHANELSSPARTALKRLQEGGATLLNQAVLLRGVNDTLEAQAQLAEALFKAGVLPYYLHLLDRVRGAAHFEVGESEARALVEALRARLPGYLVPRLVWEVAGAPSKRPVAD
ncbi:EF-P beta-lysylation protein EpmB [Thiofaba sp. EF100]|uniref:EF-P beta-lysylation protein EpmB n=1 Tax=Thiofaba sp. EF100 TaxID=3121274 RepID=UPI003221E842